MKLEIEIPPFRILPVPLYFRVSFLLFRSLFSAKSGFCFFIPNTITKTNFDLVKPTENFHTFLKSVTLNGRGYRRKAEAAFAFTETKMGSKLKEFK